MNRTSDLSKNEMLIVTKENDIEQINEKIVEINMEIVRRENEIETSEIIDPGHRLELKKGIFGPASKSTRIPSQ